MEEELENEKDETYWQKLHDEREGVRGKRVRLGTERQRSYVCGGSWQK